ncbi:MAG: type II secretion system F family protein, partial [Kiritimatiellia bacterium]|nr:type II secretion system F family protein [Kiritimatiellia bacterium]
AGEDPARPMAEDGDRPSFEAAILDAGRRAGVLDAGLDRAAAHLEESGRTRDRLLAMAVYPMVVGVVAILVAILLLGYLLPTFSRIWTQSGVELPALTRGMLAAGRSLRWAIPLLIGLGLLVARGLRRGNSGIRFRRALDRRLFRFPLIGRARSAWVSMRVARTLHLLLESGVQLIEALELAGRASGSRWIEECMAEEIESIRHGGRLSASFRRIPPLAAHLPGWVEAGEAGGELAEMLDAAATRAAETWERLLSRAMSFVEPLLFVLLGAFVFLVALSVMLPILSLNRNLGL